VTGRGHSHAAAGARSPRRGVFIFLMVAFLLTAGLVLSCAEDDKAEDFSGGYTGDIGKSCDVYGCIDWCRENDQANCASLYCIGRRDDTYCTAPCNVDGDCPSGFVCDEECNTHASKIPMCVREADFSYLQELGYCPKE
jgi:hypothetical protein